MNSTEQKRIDDPSDQLQPREVVRAMCKHGCFFSEQLSLLKVFILSVMGGGFITVGALFSMLLASQVATLGMQRLVEGFGFSVGFFFVILSQAILFTEANVFLPMSILHHANGKKSALNIARFWIIAWLGNFIGAFIFANFIHRTQFHTHTYNDLLQQLISTKLHYSEVGGISSWLKLIGSGMLANWLVGLAAFFATMSRTIIGKFIPIFLAVSLFVAANFQHSPANMAYFSLYFSSGINSNVSWLSALFWNIIPAGIGNMLGGAILVALPFWYVFATDNTSKKEDLTA